MSEKDQEKVVKVLAELVAWDGEEDNFAHAKRILAAERLLKRVAPDALKKAKDAIANETGGES